MTQVAALSVRPQWQQELAQAITEPQQLLEAVGLAHLANSHDEAARRLFALRVPRPFVAQMQYGNADDPLLRQVMTQAAEFESPADYSSDPLAEQQGPVPGLLHKYPSRVLLVLKGGCAVNCRYCFRRHFPYQEHRLDRQTLQQALAYIANQPAVNEVILSGGDPLMANDRQLAELLAQLAQLPQLQRVRIHSRLPVVIPSRLTDELAASLSQSRLQSVLVIHANHAQELSDELLGKLQNWQRQGITLLNQSVLLAGVNDNLDALSTLSERLFSGGVLPYYLHQLDKVKGASHFAVSDARAQQLWQQMLTRLPGFLVPRLVREEANKLSKSPMMPVMTDH